MPQAKRLRPVAVSIAACALKLSAPVEGNSLRLQLLPAGKFTPADGRTEGVADTGYWLIDAAIAAQVIERAQARATLICVDYEHQTLHKEKNGQPAPAAAWIDQATLEWVDGEGLFAVAKLTQRAAEAISAEEYLYFSPVFIFDKKTGAVLDLKLGALTNLPAIDGMEPLTAMAAATFAADMAALSQQLTTPEDTHMEELLERLQWLLNMPVGTTAAEFAAQLDKIKAQLVGASPEVTAAASFNIAEYLSAQHAQLAALSQQVATPDPAKFVPVALMTDLQTQLAALSAQVNAGKVDELVTAALASGQLIPAQEDWARELGKANLAALSQYLNTAPKIPALNGTQTGGQAPGKGTALDLDDARAISQAALSYQTQQAGLGINITTAQAVAHVTKGA